MAEPISKRMVVYGLPGMESIAVEHHPANIDWYRAPGSSSVVIIVAGFPDAGFERIVGCKFKDMGSTVSWARLFAASGINAIAYSNDDLEQVLQYAARFGPVGIWASSGNAPRALSLLLREREWRPRCAALLYGYTFDAEEQAKQFGFANPLAGKSAADLASDVPLLLVRAGGDEMPRLNETMDAFVDEARDLPLTVINHPNAPHAFDLIDGSVSSHAIIRQVLAFFVAHLC